MKTKMLMILCGLIVSGLANAECPSTMNKDELITCQKIEKSGANYQQWLKEQVDLANESTTSPITGKDIKEIAPAAGKEKADSDAGM